MTKEYTINITPDGVLHFLYDDALTVLMGVGKATVKRASHVEPCDAHDEHGNKLGRVVWYADMSPVRGPTLGPFDLREEALAAEVAWLVENDFPEPT